MNQRILVADDSIASQRLFEMVLRREGYDVITVGSGTQALESAREKRPDIALIDAIMPEMDGYQVCKILKETSEFQPLPVIMLAGRYEDFDREKGMNIVGAEAILHKPSQADEIVEKVKEVLRRKEEAAEMSTVAEDVNAPEAELIEEPAFVQEEYEFDDESEEADLVVENEILEEEAEVVAIEDVEAADDVFTPEQPEEIVAEPLVAEVAAVLTEQPRAVQNIPRLDENFDQMADEIAQRLAEKLVPALMQQMAAYVMQFPAVKEIVTQTSKNLVKDLLPDIQDKK